MSPKLIILDRDNTLVRVPAGTRYLYGDDPIVLLPGVAAALRHLAKRGITSVVATNQQGVSMKEFPLMNMDSVDHFNRRLSQRIEKEGGKVARFFVCPHLDSENCDCRKPRPGLFIMALRAYDVPPEDAVAIGNSQLDIGAAFAAGVQPLTVPCPPDSYFSQEVPAYRTLLHAVRAVCGGSGKCGRLRAADI
jgi:D-glycero-D-manno-heptose 1,7-bisphosphate phosphatase